MQCGQKQECRESRIQWWRENGGVDCVLRSSEIMKAGGGAVLLHCGNEQGLGEREILKDVIVKERVFVQ